MNEYDSNRIADLMSSADYKKVDTIELADYFIFNTRFSVCMFVRVSGSGYPHWILKLGRLDYSG